MVAIEQAAESVFITDTNGTIQYVNPAFERLNGYSREEAVGKNPGFFSPEYVKRIEAFSPFGFDFLKRFRKTVTRRFKKRKRTLADMDTLSTGFLTITSRIHETGTF